MVRVSKSLFLNMIFEQIVRNLKTIRILPLSIVRLYGKGLLPEDEQKVVPRLQLVLLASARSAGFFYFRFMKTHLEEINMAEVESFTLDHNKVIAPYVRLIANEHGKKGDVISNFDIRFLQPNKQEMPTGVVHTLEHLLADLLRDRLEGIIDISPFGCRTGFHLILWEERSPEDIARALKSTLEEIVEKIQFEDIQGVSAVQCGNYRDHSLFGAKEYAKQVLEQGISIDPFVRKVI